jgi:hypothetical protein
MTAQIDITIYVVLETKETKICINIESQMAAQVIASSQQIKFWASKNFSIITLLRIRSSISEVESDLHIGNALQSR